MAHYWLPDATSGTGTGNWTATGATGHWADDAGGTNLGKAAPGAGDHTIFTNGFNGAGQVVTVNAAASCLDMDWTGSTNTPTLAGSSDINCYGSLTFISDMNISKTGIILMLSTTAGRTVTSGTTWACGLNFIGTGGWTLLDDHNGGNQQFRLQKGTLDTDGFTITCGLFRAYGAETRTLTLGSSIINASQTVDFNTITNLTFTANTATFNAAADFSGGGATNFYNVNLTGATSTWTGDNSINVLGFTRADVQTLTFTGTTQTVQNIVRDNGTSVKTIVNGTFTKVLGGKVDLDYMSISGSTATANKFYAGANSTDGGTNTGWIFTGRPKFNIYTYGTNAVLKGGVEFGAEPTSLVDRSGLGNNGTYTDITDTQLASGLWTYTLNGTTSTIDCGASSGANFTSESWSAVVWGNFTSLTGDSYLISKGLNNANGWLMAVVSTGRLYLMLNYAGSHAHTYSSVSDVVTGAWASLVAVREASVGIRLYKNGVLLASTSEGNNDPVTTADNLYVGALNGTASFVDGSLALPRIFPYALTQAQITKMYNMEKPLFEGGGNRIKINPALSNIYIG